MKTDLFSYIAGSEGREKIAAVILSSPDKMWSITRVEEATGLPHTMVFRTLDMLKGFGILKVHKINKNDLVFEVVKNSPQTKQLENIVSDSIKRDI